MLVVLFGVFYIIIINYDTWAEPTAIDVYRGQTTLEINYKFEFTEDDLKLIKSLQDSEGIYDFSQLIK